MAPSTRTTAALSIAGAATFAVGFAKLTRIGPVVLVISERYGLGVHVGDLLGLLPLAGVTATVATRSVAGRRKA